MGMPDDAECGLGCKAFAPTLLPDHEGELNLIAALDVPRQQAAPTKKLARVALDCCPQAQLRVTRVAMQKPFEFFFRFLVGSRAVRVVLSDLRVAIQGVQRLQIPGLEVAQHKALGFQDDHEPDRPRSLHS